MRCRTILFLSCLSLLAGQVLVHGQDDSQRIEHEKILREAGIKTDVPSLLQFFRERTFSPADRDKLKAWIARLGDSSFAVREQASTELVKGGGIAVPLLQQALNDRDPEIARRAADCLNLLGSEKHKERIQAAARLLAVHKPAGAVKAVLDFLPLADDELEEDLRVTLNEVGIREGTVDPALLAALKDQEPRRRAAAAQVVGRSPRGEDQAAVRALLSDPEAVVRLRAAQGLVAARHKDPVPVLIALLSEAPVPVAGEAEDLLWRIAGDTAPQAFLDPGSNRREVREAWAKWWRDQETQIDLAKIDLERRVPRFPAVAPVPPRAMPHVIYVPTPQEVVEKALELARVKRNDVVYDLGCGDGRVVITAAKQFGAHGFGVDIDPQRVKESLANVQANRVEKLVAIKQADVFTLDLKGATVIYLYLLPSLNVKLIPQLDKCKPGTRIISHDFDMQGVKPDRAITVQAGGREHTLYLWTTPLKKE